MPEVHHVVPIDHPSVAGSQLVVLATWVVPLLLAGGCAIFWWRARRRARIVETSYDPDRALEAGETVVAGSVRFARGESVAVRVEIDQDGTEQQEKKGWSQQWRERSRHVTACPFYVEDGRGRRIRVEPDDDVSLVDDLDGTESRGRGRRTRSAELVDGEAIYACGELVRSEDPEQPATHRGGGTSTLVLRAPARGRLLVSSKPLGEGFHRRASSWRAWLIAYLVVWGFFQLLNVPFYASALFAEQAVAVVSSKSHGVTKKGKSSFPFFKLVIATPAGWSFDAYLAEDDWHAVHEGDRIAIRYLPDHPGSYTDLPDITGARVGDGPTQYLAVGIAVSALCTFMLALQLLWSRQGRPWYEAKLEESASGRLPET